MSKWRSFKSQEVVAILFAHGFEKVRTTGSHIRLRKGKRLVTVPFHAQKDIRKGTFKSILNQSGLKQEDFMKKRK